jgi:hypothetical protein
MGNFYSGRRGGPLVEDCRVLDLAWLMRLGPIREGKTGNGEIEWSRGGEPIASARFRLDLRDDETARLILRYKFAGSETQQQSRTQAIALISTRQHFGGRRWWMRCPVTGARVRVLYLPPGSERFASRKAWRLAYRVERLNRFDRPFEKLFRAQRRLGNAQGLGTGLERPKGMWQRTFARHVASVEQRDLVCVQQIVALIGGG